MGSLFYLETSYLLNFPVILNTIEREVARKLRAQL